LNAGYPAIRFSVAVENYNHQHQDLRVENGVEFGDTIDKMDFPYLRKVTGLNVAALAALARAPMPPAPQVEGAVSTDTTISWMGVFEAVAYVVRWRRTDSANWEHSLRVPAPAGVLVLPSYATPRVPSRPDAQAAVSGQRVVLPHVRVDDWLFGVSSVAADGSESPVAAAVPGGAFKPFTPPPAQP